MSPRLGDVGANLALYEEQLRAARDLCADLVVFPELSLTGYFLKDMVSTVALRLDSPEISRLRELSRQTALVAGLVEETPDFKFYNSAVYFEAGEIRHVHRKVYLPTYGLFDEGRYFARGDRIRSFPSKFGQLALLICEDLWHPSTIYLAALDHAVAVLCPSSSPLRGISDGFPQDDNARYWESLNRTYAQTFSLFIAYANRVGFEDGVGFWGGSEIIDPSGRTLAKAQYYERDLIVAEVNLKRARQRRVVSPMLRDEDIDLTINELMRIRERLRPGAAEPAPRALKRAAPAARRGSR
ncbi:MAG: carbon-nitrogen hydrolase [Deltaproteobacteria bacterium]|nr:carbon-nitrogen hydrolase [Deltaproteobacteria bacterium]